MHLSGIIVACSQSNVDACASAVNGLDGVEVHYTYPEKSRLIAVVESATAEQQQACLKRVQALDGVIYAEMLVHRIEDDEDFEEELVNLVDPQEERADVLETDT